MRNDSTERDDRPILINVSAEECSIAIGKKKITVDCQPIAMSQSSFVDTDLVPDGADRLVLKPTVQQYLFVAGMACLAAVVLVGMAVAAWIKYPPALIYVAIFFFLSVGGIVWWVHVLRHGPRLVFDRTRGDMREEPSGKRKPRPLADVIAVQLNRGRALESRERTGSRYSSSGGMFAHERMSETTTYTETYEVNLILDDHRGGVHSLDDQGAKEMQAAGMGSVARYLSASQQDRRRVNLLCHGKLRAARESARRLAEFLDVPLADHAE